jgi:hypothetical protein
MRAPSLVLAIAACSAPPARSAGQPAIVRNEVRAPPRPDAAAAPAPPTPAGCVDIPAPVSDTGAAISKITGDAVEYCFPTEPGATWCARVSLVDGHLTVLPLVPPGPEQPAAPEQEVHINGEKIELAMIPDGAKVRATGKDKLEVCVQRGSCRQLHARGAAGAASLTANADGSLVAVMPSYAEEVDVYDVARNKRLKRFRTVWHDQSVLHGITLVGDSLIAWEQPAGPMAGGDLYVARTGKPLGPVGGKDHRFDLYGGKAQRVRGDVWLFSGDDPDILFQDLGTGRVTRVIASEDWIPKQHDAISGLPDIAPRPSGGFVLVSPYGDVALADPDGAITTKFVGPPGCDDR